jgi:hypothetical protein
VQVRSEGRQNNTTQELHSGAREQVDKPAGCCRICYISKTNKKIVEIDEEDEGVK